MCFLIRAIQPSKVTAAAMQLRLAATKPVFWQRTPWAACSTTRPMRMVPQLAWVQLSGGV